MRAARRSRQALNLEKAISIGLKSGLAGSGARPRPHDGVADCGAAAAGKVVHRHDVAGLEGGRQHLVDAGEEGGAMHGAVEHHGCGHSAQPERAGEGGGFPVPMRHRRPAAMSSPA